MFNIILGIIAFGLYFIYDINSISIKHKFFHSFFFLGTMIIVANVGWVFIHILIHGQAAFLNNKVLFIPFIIGLMCFALMIYSLFFALPFDETYRDDSRIPTVCDTGMYALCRHPGVLWYCLFFLFVAIGIQVKSFTYIAISYSILNILYGIFQDIYSFPKTFRNYDQYKLKVPMFVPTKESFINATRKKGK